MNDLFVVDQSIKRCNDDDSSAELRFRQNVVVGLGGGVPLVVGHVCFVENSPLVELVDSKLVDRIRMDLVARNRHNPLQFPLHTFCHKRRNYPDCLQALGTLLRMDSCRYYDYYRNLAKTVGRDCNVRKALLDIAVGYVEYIRCSRNHIFAQVDYRCSVTAKPVDRGPLLLVQKYHWPS